MPLGSILLVIFAVLIYFGLAQRVLDRMQMTDRAALAWVAAMVLGGFINVTLFRRPVELIVNLGGGVVPLLWAGYLFTTADTAWEKTRAALATAVTLGTVYALGKIMPSEPTDLFLLDPIYVYAVVAAVVAYVFGRSRRASFIAALLGVLGLDLVHLAEMSVLGVPGRAWIGGGGAFDAIVLAGFLAVGIAEIVGETRERLAGGSEAARRARRREEKGSEGGGRDE